MVWFLDGTQESWGSEWAAVRDGWSRRYIFNDRAIRSIACDCGLRRREALRGWNAIELLQA